MSSVKVSALSAKTSPSGSEELLINDGGTSKKITIANLTKGHDLPTVPSGITTDTNKEYNLKLTDVSGTETLTWIEETDTDTTYSTATTTTEGLVKIEDDTAQTIAANTVTATASRTYGVQLNSSDQAVVNVPWTDTDTGITDVVDDTTPQLGGNLDFQTHKATSFTSTGIDDNATSTAITIDASENVTLTGTVNGLEINTTATSNLGLGTGAVDSITTGDYNVGVGDNALTANTTGNNNVASGSYSLYSNTTASYNTASGYSALYYNTTGANNTATGYRALYYNTSGYYNTAVGTNAMYYNTTASSNSAFGDAAMYNNTTGTNNTALGFGALYDNTTGVDNTAVGESALADNTTAHYNTAVGKQAMRSNTTGANNTATGYRALYANTTGASNTASGYNALFSNTTGYSNVALGAFALDSCTSGQSNTIVGTGAGEAITTGSNNVCIGTDSGAQGSMVNLVAANDRAVFGSQATTNAYVKVSWTVTSDERDKMNFADVPHGLSFVNSLQPIKFNFKKSRDNATPHGNARYGFKAQDILALEGDNPIIIDNEDVDNLKYQGEALMPVLVKAIQELSAKNDALEARLTALENA